MKRWRFAWAWTVGITLVLGLSACFGGGGPPPVEPTPPPPPWECGLDMPGCHETGQRCSSPPDARCWVNPTQNPHHCEEAIRCGQPPPPGACVEESDLVGDTCAGRQHRDKVKAATNALGDLCGEPWHDNLDALAATLREQNPGMCVISGIEAVFIRREDGKFDEVHAVHSGTGCWTNSGFGKWKGCHRDESAPPPGLCSLDPLPHFAKWSMRCPKEHGNWWDCAALFGPDAERCASIGYTGRRNCPVLMEGDPQRPPCEIAALGGPPLVRCSVGGVVHRNDNPWLSACTDSRAEWIEYCLPDGTRCARRDFE